MWLERLLPKCVEKKVEEKAAKGEKFVLSLLFDEMAIRKHIQFTDSRMLGFEQFDGIDPAQAKPASNGIVYMVSAINDIFQLPVAYYFITTLNSTQKSLAMTKIAKAIIATGAILASITFDGIVTNPSMCAQLNANLDVYSNDFKPFFEIDGHRIFILYDPSHTEKLVRNVLGDKKVIYDDENNEIKWLYIERLVRCREDHNFWISHKLNRSHLDFRSNIMKVKIAAETLSGSAADSIDFLMKIGHPWFHNAHHTSTFIRYFNDAFDIFNSKPNKFKENPLKRPLDCENAAQIFEIFNRTIDFILQLKIRTEKNGPLVNVCSSRVKTGFQGYVISMRSLMAIYKKYVVEDKVLSSIPTMSLSQDHLEIFFGRIRSLNGNNNNPTCQQFTSAYRRLLANTTVLYSKSGNCQMRSSFSICNPFSNILHISSRRAIGSTNEVEGEKDVTLENIDTFLNELSNIDSLERKHQLTDLGDHSLSFCANMIECKILNSEFECELCQIVLDENEKLQTAFMGSGFKRKPCRSTHMICKTADHFLKLEVLKGNFNINVIRAAIISNLVPETLFSESNFLQHSDHKLFLIKFILNEFIRIKGVYIAKKTTFKLKDSRLRQRLTKLILFKHELIKPLLLIKTIIHKNIYVPKY